MDALRRQSDQKVFAALLRQRSVHYQSSRKIWYVLGYHDLVTALRSPEIFSSSPNTVFDPHVLGGESQKQRRLHTVLARECLRLSETVGDDVRRSSMHLLERLASRAKFDPISEFARPLTDSLAAKWLGINGTSAPEPPDLRQPPGQITVADDVTWAKWQSVLANAGLERNADLVPFMRFLWVAASRASRLAIAAALLIVLRQQKIREELVRNSELVPGFCDEALRYDPPEYHLTRMTTTEVNVSGCKIPAGATVQLSVAAANRDPLTFHEPEAILIGRKPNPHLAFGAGPHRCPGFTLARVEVTAALRAFLEVMPEFRIATHAGAGPTGRFPMFAPHYRRCES